MSHDSAKEDRYNGRESHSLNTTGVGNVFSGGICQLCGQVHPDQRCPAAIRIFESGATRDTDTGKLDYEGFLCPAFLQGFAEYMHKHRTQSDGSLRASDNWQKGMPIEEYMKSLARHFMDLWLIHRGFPAREGLEDALMGIMFNVQGYYVESKKDKVSLWDVRPPG